jgi:hypothetical protein
VNFPTDRFTTPDDPGGQLYVARAGTTVVSTDALLASADRLRTLERVLFEHTRRIHTADTIGGWPLDAGLVPRLERLRGDCERARDAFGRAAEEYTRREDEIERRQRDLAAFLVATLGPAVLGMLARLIVLNPGLLISGALLGWAAIPDGPGGRLGTVKQFLLDNPALITSPEFVRFVSLMATSIDAGLLGLAGIPPVLAAALNLGSDGGVAAGALTVAALGSLLGMFRETRVEVEEVRSVPIYAAPEGARERLGQIPEGDQIRIEKYEAEGMPPRWVVYVGPTETFSPFATEDPFDMSGNIYGVAGLSGGSFRAVEEAMAQAGVDPGDEIVVSGFSQGGLVATMVVGSSDWNVYGMETYGAPAGNIPLPDGLRGFAARNTDDFIPALAGPQLDHSVMQIEREAYREGEEIPTALPAPGHQRFAYVHTAAAIDDADSAAIQQEVRSIDAFTAEYLELPGGRGTSTTYRATRVPTE